MDGADILRFDGAARRDPAIEPWFQRHSGERGDLARHWWSVVRSAGDEVLELFHDGCPVACLGDAPFAYVHVFTSHVNVGFFQGASLPDPARLLQGAGKRMRHVKLKPGTFTGAAALRRLIEAAYADIKARVEHGQATASAPPAPPTSAAPARRSPRHPSPPTRPSRSTSSEK